MPSATQPLSVKVRIVAQDPALERHHKPLTSLIEVPGEWLAPGPRGYRVHVIDYDTSAQRIYPMLPEDGGRSGHAKWMKTLDAEVDRESILEDPRFHARNAYAIVMATLARFERAFGRRVNWGFGSDGQEVKVAPHAFSDANAFYSRRDEALLFGYFPSLDDERTIFTCLSHDVVAHETTHAVLDGLRGSYMLPGSADQAAFHEGFADIVALLSVLAQQEVVELLMDQHLARPVGARKDSVARGDLRLEHLQRSVLLSIGKEFGTEMAPLGRSALRTSVALKPDPKVLSKMTEAHDRGEVLVAAVMNAFLQLWVGDLKRLAKDPNTRRVDRQIAARLGVQLADRLLTTAMVALDFCPPAHIEFGTYLSAMLTVDAQNAPADPLLRVALKESFAGYGIEPASRRKDGVWEEPNKGLSVGRTRFEAMQHDPLEVSRFIWENRDRLKLAEQAYTRVRSVRPRVRVAPEDGFHVRETVAEVLQQMTLKARELPKYGIDIPEGMPKSTVVQIRGGVTLVFDEYGQVRFAIGDRVFNRSSKHKDNPQFQRLTYQWENGLFRHSSNAARRFSSVHRLRGLRPNRTAREEW